MRVGIFDPYLDTLGGGERYMMTIAQCLANQNMTIDVFWDDQKIRGKLEERLGLDLKQINFVTNIFRTNLLSKQKVMRQYDLIFFLSDGSLPFLFARKNIVCFTVPFTNKSGTSLINQAKLRRIDQIVSITKFTKQFIDQEYNVQSKVVYPPVSIENFKPSEKENIILNVSRFSKTLHAKKQAELIDAFAKLSRRGIKNWRLLLVGGLHPNDKEYFSQLKKEARGLAVEFLPNIGFKKLIKIYSQSKIFWHATGFNEDEIKHPERMEHFGIVVVEAMASGCVPVVIGKGGIPEIVNHQKNGLLWRTKEDWISQTMRVIKSPKEMEKLSLAAMTKSQKFSENVFCQRINEIIKN